MGLREADAEVAAVAKAPRVSLADIEAAIAAKFELTGRAAARNAAMKAGGGVEVPAILGSLDVLSICILVLHNGWTVIGKSAPASAANFNAELGKKLAYEDCIRQLWPLMGFALRERLAKESP